MRFPIISIQISLKKSNIPHLFFYNLIEIQFNLNDGKSCSFKQSKMFSMFSSVRNFDKFIWSIGPRDPPYSPGRQLGLTCRCNDSKQLP